MQLDLTCFLGIPFVALALAASGAHSSELPYRIASQADDRVTVNWITLPDNWTRLRAQWEYSRAAGTLLILSAFVALLRAALRQGKAPGRRS